VGGIAECDTDTDFSEKSQANHILIVVDVAPVRGEGKVLLPMRSEQVAVPRKPLPNCGAAEGPLQLLKLKRLSSSGIENNGLWPFPRPSSKDVQVA
jgi:hypothetical protein